MSTERKTWSGQPSEPYLAPAGAVTPQAEKLEVLDAMECYGGGFVQALAVAWRKADSANSEKLHAAFSEYYEQYAKMAQQVKR
jgi:hypothetical protein